MSRRMRIGLTGGIASGKSTAAQRFAEWGIPVIDADDSARRVVAPGQPGLVQVTERFGPRILTADGQLDRRALRDRIFATPQLRRELESILHPLIRADMEVRASAALGPYLILAIPLLVEGGRRQDVDRILVVDVAEDVQLERLMARDGGDVAQARAIVEAQASRDERLQAADDVLRNSGTVSELRQAVDELHQRYLSLAGAQAT